MFYVKHKNYADIFKSQILLLFKTTKNACYAILCGKYN